MRQAGHTKVCPAVWRIRRRASAGYSGGDRVADLRGTATAGRTAARRALGDVGDGRGLDGGGGVGEAEVVEEQRRREDRGGGVGLLLARDVGRGAVDRLEHGGRGPVGVDVAGR